MWAERPHLACLIGTALADLLQDPATYWYIRGCFVFLCGHTFASIVSRGLCTYRAFGPEFETGLMLVYSLIDMVSVRKPQEKRCSEDQGWEM